MAKQKQKVGLVNVVLDEETRRAFKIYCARRDTTMSEWLRKQIDREMKNATSSDWEIPQQKVNTIDEVSTQE